MHRLTKVAIGIAISIVVAAGAFMATSRAGGLIGVQWTQIGPSPLTIDAEQNFQGAGPDSGEVTEIAIDPRGTTDQNIFISTNDGGIWKSTDGGTTWKAKSDYLATLSMGAVALDAGNPSIVYAGTGNNFSNGFLLGKIVPVVAGALVLKALLDSAEGKSPVPSIISAILALSIKGVYDMVNSWGLSGDQYGVADGLLKIVNWMGSNVCPAAGALCVIGAIINYVRGKPWGQLALTSVAMLCFSGIWMLVKSWG